MATDRTFSKVKLIKIYQMCRERLRVVYHKLNNEISVRLKKLIRYACLLRNKSVMRSKVYFEVFLNYKLNNYFVRDRIFFSNKYFKNVVLRDPFTKVNCT